jgi:fatty-acyl-CoA synthase
MTPLHHAHWPTGLPTSLTLPATSVYTNLMVSALRYPDKSALIFYDTVLTYDELHQEVLALAGYLQQRCGVQRGDRVLLNMQNSPQWVVAYFAILRADAMVVPVNPMLLTDELRHYVDDSGARVALVSQEIFSKMAPLIGDEKLERVIVATYADYLRVPTSLSVPEVIRAPLSVDTGAGVELWRDALAAGATLQPHQAGPNDMACMPYTSGTTGQPKGCVHTHRSVMYGCVAGPVWSAAPIPDQVTLAVLPFFHVTGMQVSMNATIFGGGTLVILPRWDRDVAGQLITQYPDYGD